MRNPQVHAHNKSNYMPTTPTPNLPLPNEIPPTHSPPLSAYPTPCPPPDTSRSLTVTQSPPADQPAASKEHRCWLRRYAATRDKALHNYPAAHFERNPSPCTIQSRHWSEEILNLYPIKGAARYLTVGNFASAGRSLELAENPTSGEQSLKCDTFV